MKWRLLPIICLLLLFGCIAPGKESKTASDNQVGSENTVGYRKESNTSVGDVGGEGDSISLWLAIIALGTAPLMYPAQRTLRLAWNSWRGKSGTKSGKGEELCVEYSKWDSSS